MIKRTIYIGSACYLKLKDNQLKIIEPATKAIKGSIPIEDIALLVLDHYQITISTQIITNLQANNTAIITCDAHHLPFGLMLPFYSHTQFAKRVKEQLKASEPLKKQLWKQMVVQKIKNQQSVLRLFAKPHGHLTDYWQNVLSGDTTNMEGIAAQNYWKYALTNFQRDRFGDVPNNLLNFGYAILRSLTARALVSSGLLPVIGIFHKNKYNPYALADDVMETYRPFVDKMVLNFIQEHSVTELNKQTKAYLLGIATQDVIMDGKQRPLMVALTTTTASLYKCFLGEIRQLKLPELD